MEVVYFLVVLAVVITGLIAWAFLWSVKAGQFDDLEGPAHQILHDSNTFDVAAPLSPSDNSSQSRHD